MEYKNIVLYSILVIIAMFFIFKSIYGQCPKCKNIIEYRYIPRSPEEEAREPLTPTEIYKQLFKNDILIQ